MLDVACFDQGGQYVIGYVDDDDRRKVVNMTIKRAEKYFCESDSLVDYCVGSSSSSSNSDIARQAALAVTAR